MSSGGGGQHDRTQHVALLFALHDAGSSGVLEVRRGAEQRRIYLLEGSPVWVESNLDKESLADTVVSEGLVARSIASAILDELEPEQDPAEALVNAGMLTEEILEAHLALRVERTYTAALAWADGEWTFEEHSGLRATHVEPSLRLAVPALRSLWSGVRRHVPAGAAELSEFVAGEGRIVHEDLFDRVFPALGVDPNLEDLSRLIRLGVDPDKLHQLYSAWSEDLSRLLWLLHTIGALNIEGLARPEPLIGVPGGDQAPEDAEPDTPDSDDRWSVDVFVIDESENDGEEEEPEPPVEAPAEEAAETAAPAVVESKAAQQIRAAHQARIGRDYFAFLDHKPGAKRSDIKRSFQRFEDRWKRAASAEDLPLDARRKARDLLQATRRAWKILSNDKQRRAYEARLKAGSAPVIRSALDIESGEGKS